MTAKFQKRETTATDEPLPITSAEPSMLVEHASNPLLEQSGVSGRKFRNRLIVANAIVWIAGIVAIRLIFF
jgi:hypothetical protein